MKLTTSIRARLLPYAAVLFSATYTAHAAPVLYTFTATTRDSLGSPSHLEQFQLQAPDFLPLVLNGDVLSFLRSDPALISCVACTDPPVPTLHFLRGDTSDLVQFRDADGTLRLYFFPANSLSNVGTYDTLPGINVEVGNIVVAEIPEPSTMALVIAGAGALALRRRCRTPGVRR
jgi:hypothetical protein